MARTPLLLSALLCLGTAGPARACGLALALLIDVSGSVDPDEYRTQMDGLAAALRDGVVAEALVRENAALSLVQWTGTNRQAVSIPWSRVESRAALRAFADEVARTPRRWRHFSTAIGEALTVAERAMARAPVCARRVIDVSGDGRSNEGVPPGPVRDRLAAAGIAVNALVITNSEPDLLSYFEAEVIGGPGAFAMTAESYRVYPDRIRRKLIRETARQLSEPRPRPAPRRPDFRDHAGRFVITTQGPHGDLRQKTAPGPAPAP
jgi:Ca-activated chloride channel family protein